MTGKGATGLLEATGAGVTSGSVGSVVGAGVVPEPVGWNVGTGAAAGARMGDGAGFGTGPDGETGAEIGIDGDIGCGAATGAMIGEIGRGRVNVSKEAAGSSLGRGRNLPMNALASIGLVCKARPGMFARVACSGKHK
jgi:hypothetical protein